MKKVYGLVGVLVVTFLLSACNTAEETLYVLNWGEYMDMDLVSQFEEEYNVRVVYDEVGSNEEMETKILAATTAYDIVVPSDYMIDKLRQQELLHQIDNSLLPALDDVSFMTKVTELYQNSEYDSYFVPYFWGTVGILYNTATVNEAHLTGWEVLFDPDTTYDIGMYDSARDAAASALLYLGYDVNSNDESELNEAEQALKDANFALFGEDALKRQVIQGNLDLALVYSGDYFDELYSAEEEDREITFDLFVPDTTNVWVDGFVIPTTSENVSLAHTFINFFLQEDIAVANADWVGYAPVLQEVYTIMIGDEYGYDYEHYHPYPDGANRVVYKFISDERFERLNLMLNSAKTN